MIPDPIKKVLRDFLMEVKSALGYVNVYLFGSYARGDWLYDSDIDLIVISPAFRGLSLSDRYTLVRQMLPSTISVELLLYTPEEFERIRGKSVVIQDAEEYWVKLL